MLGFGFQVLGVETQVERLQTYALSLRPPAKPSGSDDPKP